MNPIIEQSIYYLTVLVLSLFIVSFIQKGFFWKFLRVKISFGKYTMVKIRSINRDFYTVGTIQEGFLIFKPYKDYKRLSVPSKDAFYRSMGVSWIDIDDQKNAICMPDYSTVTGFDAEKYNDLYKRALLKPALVDTKERIIIGAIVIIGLICIGILYFTYIQGNDITAIKAVVEGLKVGSVAPSTL